jgi:hypothetical protein
MGALMRYSTLYVTAVVKEMLITILINRSLTFDSTTTAVHFTDTQILTLRFRKRSHIKHLCQHPGHAMAFLSSSHSRLEAVKTGNTIAFTAAQICFHASIYTLRI